ncbi:MAG TPA: PKD domain-containing protein, partial [Chitinophagales bacterium]|nr:PKD domain-containing protein [Chitinophagales bacterium]
QLPDGNFVFAGNYYADPISGDITGIIMKTDSQGNLLWKRSYGGSDDEYLYDMIANHGDLSGLSGYVICGRTASGLPAGRADMYLLKTNCMGLLTEPQAAFSAQTDTTMLTATFQNLSQFVYPDSIDGGHYIWHFGDGNTSTQANPTHTYAQGGNYTVTLTAVVCVDTSVFVQEVSTWAIGVPSAPSPYYSKVYPNPASNSLYVDHNIPSDKTAFFMLYDLYGKKLNSLPLIGKGQLALPLEDLPNGIYFAQIVMDNNIVVTEKVVIAK